MKVVIDENQENQRYDKFLRKYFRPYPEIKLQDIFAYIRKWNIKVNWRKQKENYRLQVWDVVEMSEKISFWEKNLKILSSPKENKMNKMKIWDIKKYIIYEDENWLVWNKPFGVVVHPSNKHFNDITMNDYLEKYCELTECKDNETFKPSFCYRLDKDTSWILISAKNYTALRYLNSEIKNRNVIKFYWAIVIWDFPKFLDIKDSIKKIYDKKFDRSCMVVSKDWQQSHTKAYNEKTINHKILWKISFVRVQILTWRMHQIRIHLSNKWFPILWDIIYWNSALNRMLYKRLKINRNLLYSAEYSFINLDWKKLKFSVWIPEDFKKLLSN